MFKDIDGKKSNGYCKLKPMMFAFTHEPTVFPIVRDFYLCTEHKFSNEETLMETSEPIDLVEFIRQRDNPSKGL